MKNIKYINDNLFIKSIEGLKRTKVFVNHNGKDFLLANVEKKMNTFG